MPFRRSRILAAPNKTTFDAGSINHLALNGDLSLGENRSVSMGLAIVSIRKFFNNELFRASPASQWLQVTKTRLPAALYISALRSQPLCEISSLPGSRSIQQFPHSFIK